MKHYYYGMKFSGFYMVCQPMDGFVKRLDSDSKQYCCILVYNRELTKRELRIFELEYIKEEVE